jgi:hypothetical protein
MNIWNTNVFITTKGVKKGVFLTPFPYLRSGCLAENSKNISKF